MFKRIDVHQVQAMLRHTDPAQQPLLLDIRDELSFARGHIPGAVHLGSVSLPDLLAEIAPEQPLIICCYHGISSQPAAQYIAGQGFSAVYSLDGGFTAWHQQFPELSASSDPSNPSDPSSTPEDSL